MSPGDATPAPPALDRKGRVGRQLRQQPYGLRAQKEGELAGLDHPQPDVIGDDVALEKRDRTAGGRRRQQEIEALWAFVEKTEGLQPSRAIEERRHLRRPLIDSPDVRGQLAVKESLPVAALNGDHDPIVEPRCAAIEEQGFRR